MSNVRDVTYGPRPGRSQNIVSTTFRRNCSPCQTLFTQPNNLIMVFDSSTEDCQSPHEACGKTFGYLSTGVELEDVDEYFGHHIDTQQLFVRKKLISPQGHWSIPLDRDGPFQCPLCPKIFNHAGQLAFHLKSAKHKNHRKPYICPSEGCKHATFYSLSSLLLHRETRTCEMGYRHELPKLLGQLFAIISQL
ncbi:hypothetical protein H4Q26_014833 [Puccinia striiformis f. sp. tritici PST-130]|nr:hypothetical protein H4Q26_014833 [Puccinia striiformis f. sp. tritici PST-130]